MKALVYTGPEAMEYRDAADPTPADGEALVRIDSVGICGSDMHGFLGHDARRPAPLILGHEGAGIVEGGPMDGQRVTINPLVVCGTCRACKAGREHLCENRQIISMPPREGAFAQYLTMPMENLEVVPDHASLEKAALAEPIAVSWHAVKLALRALPSDMGETALVVGGGPIGVAAVLCLKAHGIHDVLMTDPNPTRRAFLEARGFAIAPPEAAEGKLYDVTVDAVGYDATRAAACASTYPGGVLLHIGLGGGSGGLDIRYMTLQEIAFMGSYCYTKEEFRETAQAIYDGRLGALDWIEARPLSEGEAAFNDIRVGRAAAPKIILKPE